MQQRFKNDPARFKVIFGGNRSGKTECVAHCVLEESLKREKLKIWVAGESFQDSIAIQQTKIWNLLPKYRIKYGRYDEINGFTNRKLSVDVGSLTTFKSFDQEREAFQSDDIDIIWLDEEPGIDIYKECRMRLIDRNGQMIISMTSVKGVTELVDEIFEGHEILESKYAPLVDMELPRVAEKDGIKLYFLWSEENPYINQERLREEARLMTRDEILQRFYGIPLNLAGKIYVAMNKQIHVTTIEDMPEGKYSIYMVLDPHDRKPWAIGWYAVHRTGKVFAIDEYPNKDFNDMKYDDKTYADYAAIIKEKESNIYEIFGSRVRRRIIDPNFGNTTVKLARRQGGQSSTTPKKELSRLGFVFRDGIDDLKSGHLAVREWLHYERAETGEIIVQPRLMFCDNCRNHIKHMVRYSHKDPVTAGGDEKNKAGVEEKYKDFPDLVRYLRMSNPVYAEDQPEEVKFEKAY